MGQPQDDRRWTEAGIVQKYGMEHFGVVWTKWILCPGHWWNQYWVYSGKTYPGSTEKAARDGVDLPRRAGHRPT
eukprot:3674945-Ditylum_brightwellii.AAC.1